MTQSPEKIVIWDSFVRLFHWSVATLFLLDFWVLEEGDPPHEWAGYLLLILVGLRIIWGFAGSYNARFINFFPTPGRIIRHIRDLRSGHIDRREGHNPLGGAMVLLLLFMLVLSGFSGWMLNWDMFWGEDWVEELHEISANITMLLVVVHVTAVILMGRLTGIPLIKTMITGKREV